MKDRIFCPSYFCAPCLGAEVLLLTTAQFFVLLLKMSVLGPLIGAFIIKEMSVRLQALGPLPRILGACFFIRGAPKCTANFTADSIDIPLVYIHICELKNFLLSAESFLLLSQESST